MHIEFFQLCNFSLKFAHPCGDSLFWYMWHSLKTKNSTNETQAASLRSDNKSQEQMHCCQVYFIIIMIFMPESSDTKWDMKETVIL